MYGGIMNIKNPKGKIKIMMDKNGFWTIAEEYEAVDSTNKIAGERMAQGKAQGYTVLASSQSEGEGRYGRSFFSPVGTGLYMSTILRPESVEKARYITPYAAVALRRAVYKAFGIKTQIKWLNDLYLNEKKVAGILAKSVFRENRLEGVILGIGVNIRMPEGGFPENIRDKAGALFEKGEAGMDKVLAKAFLESFFHIYQDPITHELTEEYRKYCFVPGNTITVTKWSDPEKVLPARALDINEEFHLLVEYENGEREYLQSGEVSITAKRL